MAVHTTQVGIVGAGPAGLLLGHLLHLNGIDSVILENRGRDYVIDRVRAGVLEQGTVDLLNAMGVGAGFDGPGLRHEGLYVSFRGRRHRIDLAELTGGKAITVYGQNEVVQDLIDARMATTRPLHFEAERFGRRARLVHARCIRFRHGGTDHEVRCDFIAGCDGFHGICRPSIPDGVLTVYERRYPFGWLGILAEAAPSSEELVYTYHERGFALFSMRSPTITRLYFQVPPDESIDELVGRGDLGRDARAHDDAGRLAAERRAHHPEGRHADAQLRGGADALRPAVPGRRRRAHRPADGRQGAESGGVGRAGAGAGAEGVLRARPDGMARRVFGRVPAARLEGAAVLVVDDVDAAPLSGRNAPSTISARSPIWTT